MKKRYFCVLAIFGLAVLLINFRYADDPVEKLLSAMARFRTDYAHEKVHLHLDKPYYAIGDTIWLKGYVVTGQGNNLSNLSRILYVDLINDRDAIKATLRLPVTAGLAWGDLTLPDSLKEGNYRVRAYTSWMQNFGEEFFFHQNIYIAKPEIPAKSVQLANVAASDIRFFPEGGGLVNGIPSRVGFKAVGSDGLSREISGYIADQDNKKIVEFKSVYAGMGNFNFTPAAGNTYTAFITGLQKSIPLPKADIQGFVLAVRSPDATHLGITITASEQFVKTGGEVVLIAQSNNVVHHLSKIKLDKSTLSVSLPKESFPAGILQLTLFSAAMQPLAERLVFIQKQDHLNINVSTDKTAYKTREKVKMLIIVRDAAGLPVKGSFSLSVTDQNKVQQDENKAISIFSDLLLTSDLKGHIENPNYYFTGNAEEKSAALDNLLLTQGWRRFIWKDLLAEKYPVLAFRAERGITISGSISTNNGKPVAGGKVTLIPPDGAKLMDTVSDEKGRFTFDNLVFTGTERFGLQGRDAAGGRNVEVISDHLSPPLPRPKDLATTGWNNIQIFPGALYLKNKQDEMKALRRTNMLKEVKSSSTSGDADQVLKIDPQPSCPTLADCLQGKLTGVSFSRDGIPILLRGPSNTGSHNMQILLDGVPSSASLAQINPKDVESVEVLRNSAKLAMYGLMGSNGIIIINTRKAVIPPAPVIPKATAATQAMMPGGLQFSAPGYTPARQFYMPVYDTPKNSKDPDFRTTIHWVPNIMTDNKGQAALEFYNTDEKGIYQTIIEGLDTNGKLGRQLFQFEVN